jgi:hypothetical protein
MCTCQPQDVKEPNRQVTLTGSFPLIFQHDLEQSGPLGKASRA